MTGPPLPPLSVAFANVVPVFFTSPMLGSAPKYESSSVAVLTTVLGPVTVTTSALPDAVAVLVWRSRAAAPTTAQVRLAPGSSGPIVQSAPTVTLSSTTLTSMSGTLPVLVTVKLQTT